MPAFPAFGLDAAILDGVAAAGFAEPRPIQLQTIPAALEGRDILGLAQTGTGKTAAFALPILQRLGRERKPAPRALVLAPTRELAAQIRGEIDKLGARTGLRTAAVFGGVSYVPQIRTLRRGVDILVACPGRLLDLHEQRAIDLGHVETLVLDEADHMFDMGFLPAIRRIFKALPPRRQNLMFSATMPREIRDLADQILRSPHVVELAHSAPVDTVTHVQYRVGDTGKLDLLESLLDGEGVTTAIVFTRTKRRARQLADRLAKSGHKAVALQGNMSQTQRDRAMKGFRDGTFEVLVATDIASRGIDVAAVSHVINYDMPTTVDAFTHRIGRTGRATLTGIACSFVTDADRGILRGVESRLGHRIELANGTPPTGKPARHDAPAPSAPAPSAPANPNAHAPRPNPRERNSSAASSRNSPVRNSPGPKSNAPHAPRDNRPRRAWRRPATAATR